MEAICVAGCSFRPINDLLENIQGCSCFIEDVHQVKKREIVAGVNMTAVGSWHAVVDMNVIQLMAETGLQSFEVVEIMD